MPVPPRRYAAVLMLATTNVLSGVAACAALAFAIGATSAHAQLRTSIDTTSGAHRNDPGRVRGVVFDSLLMKPVANATVTMLDRSETVTSDDRGRFAFNDVSVGEHTIIFSSPEIDSLGFGTLGTAISMRSGEVVLTTVATPSLRTLWERRCTKDSRIGRGGSDSGIVWGTVRDASNGREQVDALTMFKWYELQPGRVKLMSISDVRREVITDASGLYFACGLPTEVVISSEAATNTSASGTIEYALGARRLQRLDLLISSDMIIPDSIKLRTAADSAKWMRARGNSTLRGTVTDDHGNPKADAIVTLVDADTSVRTNKLGEFVIGGLPGGTQVVQARQVGSAPTTQLVNLRSGAVVETKVKLSDVKVLAAMNVRAQKTVGADRKEFEDRRKSGLGFVLDEKDLKNRIDVGGALRMLPGVQVSYDNGNSLRVSMRGMFKPRCTPAVFLDGMPSSFDFIENRNPSDFRAIEMFGVANVPSEYSSPMAACGTLLFWSKQARW